MSQNNTFDGHDPRQLLRFSPNGELCLWTWQGSMPQARAVRDALQQGDCTHEQLMALGVVWVPSTQVLLCDLSLPVKRQAQVLAALPFALEETLTEPVEHYHFVLLNKRAQPNGSQLQVAVVLKSQMQHWTEMLTQLGLTELLLSPECFAMPMATNDSVPVLDLQVFGEPQQLWRLSKWHAAALELGWPEPFAGSSEQTVEPITFENCAWQKSDFSALAWQQLRQTHLAQGIFAQGGEQGLWQKWLWPNLAAVLLFAVFGAQMALEQRQAQQEAKAYQAQTEQLFKTLFPEVKRVVNIKAQTLNRLKSPQDSGSRAALMPLIYRLEPIVLQQPQVKVGRLSWQQSRQGGQLQLQLSSQNTAALQGLQAQLKSQAPALAVQLQIKNVTPEMTQGELNVVAN
ncbi:MAG: hypothetical protein JXR44_09535 [Thiotrichales bacterium]|nr:hypothetical protein [Thiotrichales bacterium]